MRLVFITTFTCAVSLLACGHQNSNKPERQNASFTLVGTVTPLPSPVAVANGEASEEDQASWSETQLDEFDQDAHEFDALMAEAQLSQEYCSHNDDSTSEQMVQCQAPKPVMLLTVIDGNATCGGRGQNLSSPLMRNVGTPALAAAVVRAALAGWRLKVIFGCHSPFGGLNIKGSGIAGSKTSNNKKFKTHLNDLIKDEHAVMVYNMCYSYGCDVVKDGELDVLRTAVNTTTWATVSADGIGKTCPGQKDACQKFVDGKNADNMAEFYNQKVAGIKVNFYQTLDKLHGSTIQKSYPGVLNGVVDEHEITFAGMLNGKRLKNKYLRTMTPAAAFIAPFHTAVITVPEVYQGYKQVFMNAVLSLPPPIGIAF